MPVVELHILEGYDDYAKRRLGEALTDAVRLVVPADPALVTIMIHEIPTANYTRGREQKQGAPALPDPALVVRKFLQAMEDRDLAKANTMLGKGFAMRFPGTSAIDRLEDLLPWAADRYRFVRKSYEGIDAMQGTGDSTFVYCRGTLSGEWPDGTAFHGIRFIDRFELTGGKITKQDVWNDIAEMKALS